MKNGLQPAAATHIFDTNRKRMDLFSSRWGGMTPHTTAAEATQNADVVLLAVKPQHSEGGI